MKIFYPKLNSYHNPTKDYSDGFPPYNFLETYERLELIKQGFLETNQCEIININSLLELDLLYKIHETKYIEFLIKLSDDLDENEEYIPSVFRENLEDAPIRFQGGMFCKEIGTPIQKNSFKAALNSAQTALEAAKYLHSKNESVIVLTRPPGHHAGIKTYAGYSLINNTIVASDYFLKNSLKPLILDIDYHIGDGTIEFAQKLDIPYFSLHIDPWKNYPYYDKNIQFKKNIQLEHLKHNTTAKEYLDSLSIMLETITTYEHDVLILSLGFDILQTDYCQDEFILISNDDFYTIGKLLSQKTDKKVLVCLEGGYDKPHLVDCSKKFLNGFLAKK